MNKTTRLRSEFASKFIDDVTDQTTLEGLHSLMRREYFVNTPGSFGARSLECQQAFANKYVELANTEEEIIFGTISFRWGWQLDSYSYKAWKMNSTNKTVFSLQKHITCVELPNISSRRKWLDTLTDQHKTLIKEGYRDHSRPGSPWVDDEYRVELSIAETISHHYSFCKVINPQIAQRTIISLVRKLKTYEACRMIYTSSSNYECGEILIRSMFKFAKTKEEVFFVLNSLFNKKPSNAAFAKEIKSLAKKFYKML